MGVGKPLPELTSHTHTASSFNAVAFCLLSGLHEHDDMKPSRASSFATMRQVEVSQTQSRESSEVEASLVPPGRGLHSFTLELNLSNSRTHS